MGILLADRELITCAHVVARARVINTSSQEPEEAVVHICFPYADDSSSVEAAVDMTRYFPPGQPAQGKLTDIAVLRLPKDAPMSVGRALLRPYGRDTLVKIYGFREKELGTGEWVSHPEGEFAEAKIVGPLPGGRGQADGLRTTGASVERGFSGAAVYDPTQDAIVGMVVESDVDKDKRIFQFIDTSSLQKALGIVGNAAPLATSVAGTRDIPSSLITRTRQKRQEIEKYLSEIGDLLPEPEPDARLLAYLQSILAEDNPKAESLRASFGFPKSVEKTQPLYDSVSAGEPSMQPLLGIWAQRINQLLWRFEYTLDYIPTDSAKESRVRCGAIRAICEPHLVARQPSLRDVAGALRLSKDLKAFEESAPDPTLYIVLRGFKGMESQPPKGKTPKLDPDSTVVLDFLFSYLDDLLKGKRQIDDSANAWWALRTGIWVGGERFRDFLPSMIEKYDDIIVPGEEVSRLAAVPEIHQPVSTISYTLSNIQAIFEWDRRFDGALKMDDSSKGRLHEVIGNMEDRLLKTPRSNQLYLASVHHEGLRNYLDYVEDQQLKIVGTDLGNSAGLSDETLKKNS